MTNHSPRLHWEDPRIFRGNDAEIDTLIGPARTDWAPLSSIISLVDTRIGADSPIRHTAASTAQLTEILIRRGMAPGAIIDGRFAPWSGTWLERCDRAYRQVLDQGPVSEDNEFVIGNVALLEVQHFVLDPPVHTLPEHAPLESDPGILRQWLDPHFFPDSDDPEVLDHMIASLDDWDDAFSIAWMITERHGRDLPINDIARAAAELTGVYIDNGSAPGDLINGDIAPWDGTREQRMHRVYEDIVRCGRMPIGDSLLWWGNAAFIPQGDHTGPAHE